MAQAIINHDEARDVLCTAIAAVKSQGYQPSHRHVRQIQEVMSGRHLTYRYILLTNLLAKATNEKANGLALQAGANLEGAFDSRSLCHKVVVDFDRDANQLGGKLGRSNEPYLNKPARYAALSTENAVRRGYDRKILENCIAILGSLESQADAKEALKDAIHSVMQRVSLVAEAAELDGDASLHKVLIEFTQAVVQQSCEGESCAIITGVAFYLLGRGHGKNFEIKVHPTNQAGSSSNEVLDIDVYVDKVLKHAAEVKDKPFSANDVGHAASKAAAKGLSRIFFVCGPRSQGAISGNEFVVREATEKGVRISFVDAVQFFTMCLALAPDDVGADEVWTVVDKFIRDARIKDGTHTHILQAARTTGLVN